MHGKDSPVTNDHMSVLLFFTEHVWNVVIRERDLGKTYIGEYRLCLNDRTVMFVKKACIDPTLVFPVSMYSLLQIVSL